MKKFILFILLFATFSCDKDEPKPFSEQHTEQEIFNALIGTWRPNRLAYDENFEQIECIMDTPCEQAYYITFNADSTITTSAECLNEFIQGDFHIEKKQRINGPIEIEIILSNGIGLYLSPTTYHTGPIIHNYTDSTLVFSSVSDRKNNQSIDHLYSEFKRVK